MTDDTDKWTEDEIATAKAFCFTDCRDPGTTGDCGHIADCEGWRAYLPRARDMLAPPEPSPPDPDSRTYIVRLEFTEDYLRRVFDEFETVQRALSREGTHATFGMRAVQYELVDLLVKEAGAAVQIEVLSETRNYPPPEPLPKLEPGIIIRDINGMTRNIYQLDCLAAANIGHVSPQWLKDINARMRTGNKLPDYVVAIGSDGLSAILDVSTGMSQAPGTIASSVHTLLKYFHKKGAKYLALNRYAQRLSGDGYAHAYWWYHDDPKAE